MDYNSEYFYDEDSIVNQENIFSSKIIVSLD